MTVEIITVTGAGTWTVPTGITNVTVEGWGGGGGGGAGDSGNGGGGGGGGAYSRKAISGLTPGAGINYNVGVGGNGSGIEGNGQTGGDTWFDSTGVFLAKGGAPGTTPSGGAGAGGAAGSGVGDTKFSGGNGAGGLSANGGGGGAGDANNGSNASGGSGGAGGSANGGNGGNSQVAGAVRGGGGGGASDAFGSSAAGGRGELRITYQTIHQGAIVLASTATVTPTAKLTYRAAALLPGSALLAPLAKVTYQVSALLAAAGTITPFGGKRFDAAVVLASVTTLVAVGDAFRPGNIVLAASATVAPTGRLILGGASAMVGSAAFSGTADVTSLFLETRQPKNVLFHVYTAAGVFTRTWPDVMDYPEFEWPLNSGPGEMRVRLPRPWGDAGEPGEVGSAGDIQHGNLVKVIVFDVQTPQDGLLVYQGVIGETLANVQGELFEVTLVPKTTQFNDLVINEPITFTDMDPTDMVEWLVDNDYMPGITFDPANPLVGSLFSLSYEKGKVAQLLDIIRGLAGGIWYSRLNADNSLTFNKWSPKVAIHQMVIGVNVAGDVEFERSSLDVKKRVLLYGAEGILGEAVLPGYDPAVDGAFDLALSNPRVMDGGLARRLAAAELELREAPTIATRFTVIDNHLDDLKGWDIESVKPGDTIALVHPNNRFVYPKWDGTHIIGTGEIVGGGWNQQVQHPYVVVGLRYGFDHIDVQLRSLALQLPSEVASVNDRLFLASAR